MALFNIRNTNLPLTHTLRHMNWHQRWIYYISQSAIPFADFWIPKIKQHDYIHPQPYRCNGLCTMYSTYVLFNNWRKRYVYVLSIREKQFHQNRVVNPCPPPRNIWIHVYFCDRYNLIEMLFHWNFLLPSWPHGICRVHLFTHADSIRGELRRLTVGYSSGTLSISLTFPALAWSKIAW